MFLLSENRSEAWMNQVSKIVDSINGFWSVCLPVDASKETEENLQNKYESFVSYKFINPKEKITLSNSLKMMKHLFTLLKLTLNQSRIEPYFVHGTLKMNELLQCLEGIISAQKFDTKGNVENYLGLTPFEFNILCVHCKIDALETLRQIVLSYNIIDHFAWLKRCIDCVLKSEVTIESHNLMCESLALLQACINKFGFGMAKIAINVLVKGKYLVSPDLMNHILTLFKIVLLRKDKTQIKIEGSKLKVGLKILENVKDVSSIYDKYSTSDLESKLYQYLKFINCCIENCITSLCTKRELCIIDNGLYTILNLSYIKFSPLRRDIKLLIFDIATKWVMNNQFSAHSHFILSALLHFIEMTRKGEIDYEFKSKLEETSKIINTFAGCDKFYTDEKGKLDGVYSEIWIDINTKSLLNLISNESKKLVQSSDNQTALNKIEFEWMKKAEKDDEPQQRDLENRNNDEDMADDQNQEKEKEGLGNEAQQISDSSGSVSQQDHKERSEDKRESDSESEHSKSGSEIPDIVESSENEE